MTRLIAVGASSGGVEALHRLIGALPADLKAAVLVVLHIGNRPSQLPAVLSRRGGLPVEHAVDGEPILPGRVYVAPPDHHMLVHNHALQLTRGPKEHHTRPAIDPLFRSVALSAGPAVIGVVLTGMLDDGTAGLQFIKKCAGLAVVQSPEDAFCPDMPRSAFENVEVDHCVPLQDLAPLLVQLVSTESERKMRTPPSDIVFEQDLLLGRGDPMASLRAIGKPSTFTCPDCHGTLWEVTDSKPPRLICHTGHAYSLRTLHQAATESTDEAVWNALRATQETSLLLRYRAERDGKDENPAQSERWRAAAKVLEQQTALLRALLEEEPPSE